MAISSWQSFIAINMLALLAALLPLSQALFFGGGGGCGCSPCAPRPVCAPPPAPVCPPSPCGGGGFGGFGGGLGGGFGGGYGGGGFAQPAVGGFAPQAIGGYSAPVSFQGPAVAVQQVGGGYVAGPSFVAQASNAAVTQATQGAQQTVIETTAAPAEASEGGDNTEVNAVYDDIATATSSSNTASSSYPTEREIRRAPPSNFDPKCNSDTLKNIIVNNIGESTSSSKRAIQKAASEEVGGHIDVVCSTGTFSYIVNTEVYCETEKDGITCFAFRQSN